MVLADITVVAGHPAGFLAVVFQVAAAHLGVAGPQAGGNCCQQDF